MVAEDGSISQLKYVFCASFRLSSRFWGNIIQSAIHEERTKGLWYAFLHHANLRRSIIDWGQRPNLVPMRPSSPAPSVAGRHCRCQHLHRCLPRGGILSIAPHNCWHQEAETHKVRHGPWEKLWCKYLAHLFWRSETANRTGCDCGILWFSQWDQPNSIPCPGPVVPFAVCGLGTAGSLGAFLMRWTIAPNTPSSSPFKALSNSSASWHPRRVANGYIPACQPCPVWSQLAESWFKIEISVFVDLRICKLRVWVRNWSSVTGIIEFASYL